MMLRFSVLATVPLLAACAAEREPALAFPTTRLPDAAEVAAWVRADWPNIGPRLLRMSGIVYDGADLIAVEDVACYSQYGTPECSYVATAGYGQGRTVRQQMFAQFDRDADGRLVEVIVMWHPRRR